MKTWPELDRRQFLVGSGMLLGASILPRMAVSEDAFTLPEATRKALGTSPLVYVSPLHPDGEESTCHGEVWFFEYEGDVVLATGKDRWKARAIRKGWDGARIWVGDFGPVKQAGDKFRSAPGFRAKARFEKDRKVFDALMETFGKKYPEEWGKWEPRFREGYADGSRVVIRYEADGA